MLGRQVCWRYSCHDVSGMGSGVGLWALFCKARFRLTLPHLSSGLILVHFTLGPKLPTPAARPPPPEAWQRWGLSNSCSVLAALAQGHASPSPVASASHNLLTLLPDRFQLCSQMQFKI